MSAAAECVAAGSPCTSTVAASALSCSPAEGSAAPPEGLWKAGGGGGLPGCGGGGGTAVRAAAAAAKSFSGTESIIVTLSKHGTAQHSTAYAHTHGVARRVSLCTQ